jgi:serine/threonine protein kinase
MEYVEGSSLADLVTRPMKSAEQAAALVEVLARAIHHAHERGHMHEGLKPCRVRIAADGTCKIIGLGLARLWSTDPDLLNYRAPEQAEEGEGAVGPAADVYALGAML